MEAFQPLNDALKRRGIRGRIVAVKDRLFLRGTFATVDGARKDRRIALGLPAQQGQLLEAENRVVALAAIIATTGIVPAELPWDAPAPVSPGATLGEITVADAVSQLERDFWQGKVRTSAAERTWDRLKAETDRLPQAATLTMDLMVAVAANTEAGSRTRLESCKVLKRLAVLVGITGTDRLDALRTPYEPAVRDIPDDLEIGAFLGVLDNDEPWAWATWALVTYGCRPSEVFSLKPQSNGTAQVLTIKRKGKLPTWRTTLELPVSYPRDEDDDFSPPLIPLKYDPRFHQRSVPWEVNSPTEYDSATAKLHTDRWSGWLRRRHETFQLYSFRHAWAIRSIRKNLNASLAAKCMGHDVATHHREYHRWIDEADIAAVAARLIA